MWLTSDNLYAKREQREVGGVIILAFYSEESLDWKTDRGKARFMNGWRKEGTDGGEKVGIQD